MTDSLSAFSMDVCSVGICRRRTALKSYTQLQTICLGRFEESRTSQRAYICVMVIVMEPRGLLLELKGGEPLNKHRPLTGHRNDKRFGTTQTGAFGNCELA